MRTASRDLRLSRVRALLPDHAEGTFRTGAQADREARQPDPEAHQGRTASADAQQHLRGCHIAWLGYVRLAALLRGTDQLPIPQQVRAPPQATVATRLASPVAEGPLHMGQSRPPGWGLLASASDSSHMAEQAICRQPPEVGASCHSGHAVICAGGVGQPASLLRPSSLQWGSPT